ncbi:hypothetical protein DFA_02545 [Cavenderia fasciculata]|uniref:Uncharacterized protein n=1 Tax=Cavenderia fasciculata TaxID=261658 RepID=F4PZP2_CACFS|nr:uncharacterized protein DFA_02545 [Cavenderia fasciculata]EGG18806.1 hypothetical protein DFA_02545 [Cavenderia fasciculata]|eukprot:XP_004357268.1 hypothetical protein DFA_02545 [Cavenderia fasciculata]
MRPTFLSIFRNQLIRPIIMSSIHIISHPILPSPPSTHPKQYKIETCKVEGHKEVIRFKCTESQCQSQRICADCIVDNHNTHRLEVLEEYRLFKEQQLLLQQQKEKEKESKQQSQQYLTGKEIKTELSLLYRCQMTDDFIRHCIISKDQLSHFILESYNNSKNIHIFHDRMKWVFTLNLDVNLLLDSIPKDCCPDIHHFLTTKLLYGHKIYTPEILMTWASKHGYSVIVMRSSWNRQVSLETFDKVRKIADENGHVHVKDYLDLSNYRHNRISINTNHCK